MNNLFLNKKHSNMLSRIEEKNVDEMTSWTTPNVIYPISVVAISSLCFILFKPENTFTWVGWINLFFNGSLAMIALNRMSSLGINLLKYDKSKEKASNIDTRSLRFTIDTYAKILMLGIVILYVFQVINSPVKLNCWLIVQFLVSALFIYEAMFLSKNAYLLQEKMLEYTIGDDIRETTQENKKHLSEKYGDQL